MKYISVFSGIEAASVAWEPLGFNPVAFSEIEAFPCKLLKHYWPNIPNVGDITKFNWSEYHGTVDIVVGGSPCQDYSFSGKRLGLAGERGQLAIAYVRMVQAVRPTWIVWENVPGVLSTNGGDDFRKFTSTLVESGYHVAWRILDAQYFGVPQRRRRVFLVGHIGDWRRAAAVLFEPESLRGDTKKSRKERESNTSTLEKSATKDCRDHIIAKTLLAHGQRLDPETENFICSIQTAHTNANGTNIKEDGIAYTHDNSGGVQAIYCPKIVPTVTSSSPPYSRTGNSYVESEALVISGKECIRRITPLECERLMGFPDNFTDILNASDTARYKALGNSIAVPVLTWIGRRIQLYDE